jgi:hypothetical protein
MIWFGAMLNWSFRVLFDLFRFHVPEKSTTSPMEEMEISEKTSR